jgi:hypothetical protein
MELSIKRGDKVANGSNGKKCLFSPGFSRAGYNSKLDYRSHATKINPTLTRIVIGVSR